MSAAAAQLAPSVLREVLLAGPAGGDPLGEALVGLLHNGGLLACPDLVLLCVDLDTDDLVAWADLDLPALRSCARGDLDVEMSASQRRLLSLAVALVDLDSLLRALDGPSLTWAVAAFLAVGQQALQWSDPPPAGLADRVVTRLADLDADGPDARAGTRYPPPRPGRRATSGTSSQACAPQVARNPRAGRSARRRQLQAAAAALARRRTVG